MTILDCTPHIWCLWCPGRKITGRCTSHTLLFAGRSFLFHLASEVTPKVGIQIEWEIRDTTRNNWKLFQVFELLSGTNLHLGIDHDWSMIIYGVWGRSFRDSWTNLFLRFLTLTFALSLALFAPLLLGRVQSCCITELKSLSSWTPSSSSPSSSLS